MSYKKIITMAVAIASASFAAQAHEVGPKVTLGGTIDTQLGFRDQKAAFDVNSSGDRLHKAAIVNDTTIKISADGKSKGMNYGAMILLNADTSRNKFNMDDEIARHTLIYVSSDKMGKLEAGSYQGVYPAMKVSGSTIAKATGGIDGDWAYWVDVFSEGRHINTPVLPVTFEPSKGANSAKVNYYSPSYNGFNFGVTFIPDIDQHGTVTRTKSVARDFASSSNDSPYNGAMGYKNIFQGALAYEGKMSQVAVKLSATGEVGDAKKDVNTGAATTYNRHDLRAYELGGSLGYKCFTLGGSYGNWGKSGAYKSTVAGTPVGGKKDGHFWTAGLAYEHEKFGASFTHFNSKSAAFAFVSGTPAYSNLKADTKTYSLGMDYKLAPGFMPYAELTMFDMKDKAANTKNDGSVLLFGTKLNF